MQIRLTKAWGSLRRGKIIDYPENTARYFVERVKVAEYVNEPVVIKQKITQTPSSIYKTEEIPSSNVEEVDDQDEFDIMTPEQLRETALILGVEVHHRAGPDKVREALKKHKYQSKVMQADVDE